MKEGTTDITLKLTLSPAALDYLVTVLNDKIRVRNGLLAPVHAQAQEALEQHRDSVSDKAA